MNINLNCKALSHITKPVGEVIAAIFAPYIAQRASKAKEITAKTNSELFSKYLPPYITAIDESNQTTRNNVNISAEIIIADTQRIILSTPSNPQSPPQSWTLYPGWNLISIPENIADPSITALFTNSKIITIFTYDPTAPGGFLVAVRETLDSEWLGEIEICDPLKGYWVFSLPTNISDPQEFPIPTN